MSMEQTLLGADPIDPAAAQTLPELRARLRANFLRDQHALFGLNEGPWLERATQNWFDDTSNYDRRWRVMDARGVGDGRVLDMACGCGTFLLHGLNKGRDVWGVEPERWKQRYFRRKVELSGYPGRFVDRFVPAVGERLPFAEESFDLVTTFQTLEHVAEVDRCISEMLRVLRPGGVLYLRCPDYNSFFEGHYRVPFLPAMRRDWAERYLAWLGKPLSGLKTINYTTDAGIRKSLGRQGVPLRVTPNRLFFVELKRREIEARLPRLLQNTGTSHILNGAYQLKRKLAAMLQAGRQERVIDLWVTKLPAAARRAPTKVVPMAARAA